MSKLASSIARGLIGFTNKSLIKHLMVITLCILFILVQVFYPYQFYESTQKNASAPFQVGIHYVYEQDNLDQIYDQVTQIHNLGFRAIRITLNCNPDIYNDTQNQKLDVLFSATDNYGLKVALVIPNLEETAKVDYYLNRWGSHFAYIQVMNEPELSSTWSVGS